jgi:hypothetical protein
VSTTGIAKVQTEKTPAISGGPKAAMGPPVRDSTDATDDEILGLDGIHEDNPPRRRPSTPRNGRNDDDTEANQPETGAQNETTGRDIPQDGRGGPEIEALEEFLEANPDLRRARDDAQEYRKVFTSPEDARQANVLIGDLNRLDALFFSRSPEDHAELARSIAELDPMAFDSLVKAMSAEVGKRGPRESRGVQPEQRLVDQEANRQAKQRAEAPPQAQSSSPGAGLSPAQAEFFQTTNAAAVQGVVDAIETQVERLLPEGASKTARNRVVGEIYRELDAALRENQQLALQLRDAFRSGGLDASHQRAIVSLITGRARQALPSVAKKVINEWTTTILAANHDRRARQRAAERRVDIAGSGGAANEGRRATSPRDIDYSRMSDSDILNL